MEKEEFLEPEPTSVIDEPHFEEAWTVLAARPVEPLAEVRSDHKLRDALKLVGGFLVAGLLGVVVGLASIRFRQVPGSVEVQGPTQTDSTEAGSESGTEDITITPEVEAIPMKTPARVTEAPKRQAVQSTASAQKPPEPADGRSGMQPQLAEQWQERRPRRIRRYRREMDELHHRDLLRIQEIFEGRRP
jgi:hypothetical protein